MEGRTATEVLKDVADCIQGIADGVARVMFRFIRAMEYIGLAAVVVNSNMPDTEKRKAAELIQIFRTTRSDRIRKKVKKRVIRMVTRMKIREVHCRLCGQHRREDAENALRHATPKDVCTKCWTSRDE